MQIEQAIASAIIAMQDPVAFTQPSEDTLVPHPLVAITNVLLTELNREHFHQDNRSLPLGNALSLTAKGRYSNADSPALQRFAIEAANLSKVYPDYPQPALITVRLHVPI